MTRPERDALRRQILHDAQLACSRGWPVFPLQPYSKIPAVADWEHQATLDLHTIRTWWTRRPYNVAVACGPAQLLVLDLDTAQGVQPPHDWATRGVTDGRGALSLLARQAGQHLTPTYQVLTPSGGEHLYYHRPPGLDLRNTAGTLGWRIDTRAAGGYVVAAGSVRRSGDGLLRYQAMNTLPAAPLPDWLAVALTPRPVPRPDLAIAAPLSPIRLQSYADAAMEGEARAVAEATPGTRNHTLFRAAASLGELVGAGVLPETTATDSLLAAAARHVGIDGFSLAEARRTIRNGLRRGRENPRQISGEQRCG